MLRTLFKKAHEVTAEHWLVAQIINRLILLMAETNALSFSLAVATVVLLAAVEGELWYYVIDSALALVRPEMP